MIPREILKNIRQIDLRTNRIVTESAERGCPSRSTSTLVRTLESSQDLLPIEAAAGGTPALRLFQPPAQFRRIPRVVPDGADNYFRDCGFDYKKNGIRPRFRKSGFAGQPADHAKSFRVFTNDFEKGAQVAGKSLTDPRFASVVEVNRLGKFLLCFFFNDDAKRHCLARNRFSMSATTSSSGRQSSGCASARSARQSSSAICPGVRVSSKPSNFSRRCSKTSRCSSNGSFSTCSKTWVALMAAIYPFDLPAQARVCSLLKSAIANRQSAISP